MTKSIWAFKVNGKVKLFVSKDLANFHAEKLKSKPQLVEVKMSQEQFVGMINAMDNKNHNEYVKYVNLINSIVLGA